MPLNNPTIRTVSTSGTYTGDNAANRAIPHGLDRLPTLIEILDITDIVSFEKVRGHDKWRYESTAGHGDSGAVTTPTVTNFYVGDGVDPSISANNNTRVHHWMAMG